MNALTLYISSVLVSMIISSYQILYLFTNGLMIVCGDWYKQLRHLQTQRSPNKQSRER